MVSRSTGPSTSSTSLPDNRLEQMREQQLKQLQEMQLAHTRDDAERLLDNVVRKLQAQNSGQRVAGNDPNAASTTRAPSQPDPGNPGRATTGTPRGPAQNSGNPTSTAPATANPVTSSSPSSSANPGASSTTAPPPPPPSQRADLGKLIADFQRQNGLPVTGKLDQGTVSSMKDSGVLDHSRAPPSSSSSQQQQQQGPSAKARPEDTAAARQARSAADQQVRQRMEGPQQPSPSAPRGAQVQRELSTRDTREASKDAAKTTLSNRDTAPTNQVDKVIDPARLLASLVAMGFGKQGSLEEKIKAFQQSQGMPPTGKADPATAEAIEQHAATAAEAEAAAKKAPSEKPVEQKQQVRRALNEVTSKNAADKDVNKDPLRPQANTNKPTTSSEVAARAPVGAASADAAAEKARLDTVLGQQHASERGVQEGTGDPKATQGHGEVKGEGAGVKGSGGTTGGGNVEGKGEGGAAGDVDGPEGDESAVGNATAGDDDFNDDDRGNANMGDETNSSGRDADGNLLPGFWEVPELSIQVRAALNAIVRDDDGSGPVTYTWDVTFLKPGVYADGQPGQELWHVVVHKATAFDGVWQTAADAIASRMLYAEPDAQAPTIDDFILALRRARVR